MGESSKIFKEVGEDLAAKQVKGILSNLSELQDEINTIVRTQKPKLLFLDDRSKRLHAALKKYGGEYDVTLVCTVKECIKMLSNEGPWDVVSLDHDLDFEEFVPSLLPNTGMEVVRWLCENVEFMKQNYTVVSNGMMSDKSPWIIIHTSNQAASFDMYTRLCNVGYRVKEERFTYDD